MNKSVFEHASQKDRQLLTGITSVLKNHRDNAHKDFDVFFYSYGTRFFWSNAYTIVTVGEPALFDSAHLDSFHCYDFDGEEAKVRPSQSQVKTLFDIVYNNEWGHLERGMNSPCYKIKIGALSIAFDLYNKVSLIRDFSPPFMTLHQLVRESESDSKSGLIEFKTYSDPVLIISTFGD